MASLSDPTRKLGQPRPEVGLQQQLSEAERRIVETARRVPGASITVCGITLGINGIATNTGYANNTTFCTPILIPGTVTLTGLSCHPTTTPGATIRSALYDSNGTRVGNKSSGVTVTAGDLLVPFDAQIVVKPGIYYGGFTMSSTAIVLMAMYSTGGLQAAGPGSSANATSINPATLGFANPPCMMTY